MRDDERTEENLPQESHLQDDISAASDQPDETADHFTPGQTNAGQQVAGLASATGHGDDQNPDSGTDSNNPV